MNGDMPSGCQCELCYPNLHMGRDGYDYKPDKPETFPLTQLTWDEDNDTIWPEVKQRQLVAA
jgi:hypothetical protein